MNLERFIARICSINSAEKNSPSRNLWKYTKCSYKYDSLQNNKFVYFSQLTSIWKKFYSEVQIKNFIVENIMMIAFEVVSIQLMNGDGVILYIHESWSLRYS